MTSPTSAAAQPVVVHGNDWSGLVPPGLDTWTPTRTVSVVVPAFECQGTLDLVLAALAAQTYPSSLLEVVVVDDSSTPPLALPELRPETTRLLRTEDARHGWGPGHSRDAGARAAEGEVLHWLDSDMLVFAEHVAAQVRWHDLLDHVVTLGYKRFVEPRPMTPREVHDAVRSGAAASLYDLAASDRHEWVEALIEETDGLRTAGFEAFRVHVGATATVRRDLYLETGGMDHGLKLGEDSELGYRLAQAGAVFVPEPEARSWHLGRSTIMRTVDLVTRHNRPYITDRMPVPRYRRRREPGRLWTVPLVEVVVEAAGAEHEAVKATVDSVLRSSVTDLSVTLVGEWGRLHDGRRATLTDPDLELRLTLANYAGDPRVRLVESVPETAFPAPFRLRVPAGWALASGTVDHLFRESQQRLLSLAFAALPDVDPDVAVLRWERTAAVARALRLRAAGAGVDGAPLDDLVDRVGAQRWYDASDLGIRLGWPAPDQAEEVAEGPPVTAEQWRAAARKANADARRWKADALRWKAEAKAAQKTVKQLSAPPPPPEPKPSLAAGLTRRLRGGPGGAGRG